MRGDCLTDDAVLDWIEGRLPEDERASAEAHLEDCSVCADVVAMAAGGRTQLAPGSTLGRYTIVSVLGAGGMGVVYAAEDRELQRKVALKLMRHDREASPSSALLQREAQVLARLSHPNVVAVYDVALLEDHVAIAMELVDGVTLRQWLDETPRTFAAIGAVLRQAAAGLIAAHAMGIVHRDFKPENVLVGRDGRVRVSDFGLSRFEAASEDLGAIVGTPAYMAPEQKAGEPVDTRADIYAFAVVAWEAWFGARPMANERRPAMSLGARGGTKRALWAALANARTDRPATLAALLTSLDRAARRPRRWIAATTAVSLFAATGFGATRLQQRSCDDEVSAWNAVWSAAHQRALAANAPADLVARVDALFAAYVDAGRRAETETCHAHRASATSSALHDQQALCLRGRRHEAATIADALTKPDAASRAIAAASTLPTIESCTTAPSLVALAPLPNDPAKRHQIDTLTATIAEAQAARTLAQFPQCVALAKPAAEQARVLDYAPVHAKALLVWARCREFTDSLADSETTLHAAATAAQRGGDLRTLGEAWSRLVFTVGYEHRDFVGSDRWGDYTRSIIERLGGDADLEYRVALNTAQVHSRAGRGDTEALFERAKRAAIRFRGDDSIEAINATMALANHWQDRGDVTRAIAIYREGLAFERRRFGPGYAGSMTTLANIVLAELTTGKNVEALATAEELMTLSRANPGNGDDHMPRQVYAMALRANHKVDAALAEDRAAAATCAKFRGEDWDCAFALAGVGLDLLDAAKPQDAIPALQHAWQLREKDEQPDPEIALGYARALWDGGGDRKLAETLGRRARDVQKQTLAAAPSETNRTLLNTIETWLAHHGS